MGRDLWLLGGNDTVDVYCREARSKHLCQSRLEHFARVAIFVRWIVIGKHLSDIAQCSSTQQGVCDRMQQHIGITVADGVTVMRNIDPT